MTDTLKAWSYNRLKTFEQCPYRAKLKYLDKLPIPDDMDRTALERGNLIHQMAEDYVQGKRDDIPKELIKVSADLTTFREAYETGLVIVEQDWAFDREWATCGWSDDKVWLRAKLDVFYKPDEDYAIVNDWKSGKKFGNEISHIQQGQVYTIAAFMRDPALNVVDVQFAYTDHGQYLKKTYTREKAMRMLPTWQRRAENCTDATEFPAKPNKMNCRFCEYGPNNNGANICDWGIEV